MSIGAWTQEISECKSRHPATCDIIKILYSSHAQQMWKPLQLLYSLSDIMAMEKTYEYTNFYVFCYNEDAYLENVIPLLINALPVAGIFCGIITAIEIIRKYVDTRHVCANIMVQARLQRVGFLISKERKRYGTIQRKSDRDYLQ